MVLEDTYSTSPDFQRERLAISLMRMAASRSIPTSISWSRRYSCAWAICYWLGRDRATFTKARVWSGSTLGHGQWQWTVIWWPLWHVTRLAWHLWSCKGWNLQWSICLSHNSVSSSFLKQHSKMSSFVRCVGKDQIKQRIKELSLPATNICINRKGTTKSPGRQSAHLVR